MVQQAAGQRQNTDNLETMGIASYQHIFSAHAVGDFRGMVRDNANDFYSNPESTPIIVFQHNWFREGYFKGSVTMDRGPHEWKIGGESDNSFLNEMLNYAITDPTRFDPGSPATFAYQDNRPDLEQSIFVQDLIRLHNWTINAGMRWDHYQLLVNHEAFQPRLAISRAIFQRPALSSIFLTIGSFQTPSSGKHPALREVHRPLHPSIPQVFFAFLSSPRRVTTTEATGLTNRKVFSGASETGKRNYFRRLVDNCADDSQIENTTISFPISFRKAIVYGAEGRRWTFPSGAASPVSEATPTLSAMSEASSEWRALLLAPASC